MTYAAKREKVFDWQRLECTPPLRRSDHRLKRFSSTCDKRAWDQCDEIRSRHLYDLMSGSQTCLSDDQCHKYVPLNDLINILMSEKDELIRQLQEQLRRKSQTPGDGEQGSSSNQAGEGEMRGRDGGTRTGMGADGGNVDPSLRNKGGTDFSDSDADEAGRATGDSDNEGLRSGMAGANVRELNEVLQNRVAELTNELNNSRNMLRQAMHKLQNIDEIVNENKKLQCRLRCSEERIKYLEEKKRNLESELANLRSKSQIQIDLEKAQQMLSTVTQKQEESVEMDEAVLQTLTLERDELQDKVKKLEKELEESKKKETEIEMLRKQSQSDSFDREEMSRENECYRKTLASMKCLEKQIQELKKQGRALADKYKRETQRAAEQMNKMNQAAKELQALRNERDSLRKRVNELASYESQYNSLQRKLQQVEAVIAENECLNSKLLALQNLEKENEYLRCRLETLKEMETTATEDKERIMQLQCAVADQEEEMKDLLCQIERLTNGKHEEELERLKCELYEKNSKLKLCEEQLAEIPMLEAEIDELRLRLQCFCRDLPTKKTGEQSYQKLEVRLPSTSKGIRVNYKSAKECSSLLGAKREEAGSESKIEGSQVVIKEESETSNACQDFSGTNGEMSCEEVQSLLQSSKGIISCVLEDMIEHQKEMEELERCNKAMKEEIDALKKKVGGSDRDDLLREINNLKQCLKCKNMEIAKLQDAQNTGGAKALRDIKCEEGEFSGSKEIKPDPDGVKSGTGLSGIDPDSDCFKALQRETYDLKLQIQALNKLTCELKKENELLRELQKPGPDFSKQLDEKCALENLISLLQAELDSYKGQKLSNECEALRNELKRVMELNCDLKTLVNCYRQRLNLEKKSNELKTEAGCSGTDGTTSFQVGISKSQGPDGTLENLFGKMSEEERLKAGLIKLEPEGENKGDLDKNLIFTDGTEMTGGAEKGKLGEDMLGSGGPGAGGPGAGGPGAGGPGAGGPGEGGLGAGGPGAGGLGSDGLGAGGAGAGGAGAGGPGAGGPGAGGAGAGGPGAEGLGSDGLGAEGAGAGGPGAGGAGAGGPGAGGAGAGGAGAGGPGAGGPGAGGPGGGSRGPGTPGGGARGPGTPGSGARGPGTPGSGARGPGTPGGGGAKGGGPKSGGPGAGGPGAGGAGSDGLEGDGPGSGGPGGGGPGSGGPGGGGPGSGGPGAGGPGAGGPGSGARGTTTPGGGTRGTATPGGGARGHGAQGGGARESGTPGSGTRGPGTPGGIIGLGPAGCGTPARGAGTPGSGTRGPGTPGCRTPGGGTRFGEKIPGDCLKELEQLKKEKNDLQKQLDLKKEKMKQMEADNAEKLKKLMDQHKKEMANQEKIYNENLSSMKHGYETGIRKLSERHKQSVVRLQELHQDEVQEINSNYEAQLGMMQSQSEAAINDIAQSSAARIRKLVSKHSKEMGELRDSMEKSARELDSLKKQDRGISDKDFNKQMKIEQARLMQKMRRTSQQKMSAMKMKFEESKLRFEEENEDLKKKLKDQSKVCDCCFAKKTPRKPRDPCCPLDFNEVLEKILEEGLDSLTFNEIALVHRKTCCALEGIVMRSKSNPMLELEPPVIDTCPHTPLLEADRQQLLSRIFALENEILQKQKQTQDAIISMEVAIKKERCRLQELRNTLESEQQKNSMLKLFLNSQTKVQSDLKRERDRLGNEASMHQMLCQERGKQLDEEIKTKKCLEMEIAKLKADVKHLCAALDAERRKCVPMQKEHAEQFRGKMDHTVHQERRTVLESETKCKMQQDIPVQGPKQLPRHMVKLPAVENCIGFSQNPLEAKSAKERKNLDQIREKKNKIKTKCKKQKK